MLKRILIITARDIKSGFRDLMVVFIIIIPFLLAFALSLFVPSAGAATYQYAVEESLGSEIIEYLSHIGNIEVMGDRKSIQQRVLQNDDIVGILENNGQYEVILEGNEKFEADEITQQVLTHFQYRDRDLPLAIRFSDIGWKLSPLAQYGAISLIIMTTALGGMMIAFNIVEEKQSGTISAVNVSPASRLEFVAGKSLMGFVIPVIQSIGVMLIFKFTAVNFAMLILVVLCSSLVGIMIGFVIGMIANDQISAVSNMKMTFLPITASVLGAILLPEKWLPALYWSPFYWTFAAVNDLVLNQAAWGRILLDCGAILLLAFIVFLLLGKRIQKGLA